MNITSGVDEVKSSVTLPYNHYRMVRNTRGVFALCQSYRRVNIIGKKTLGFVIESHTRRKCLYKGPAVLFQYLFSRGAISYDSQGACTGFSRSPGENIIPWKAVAELPSPPLVWALWEWCASYRFFRPIPAPRSMTPLLIFQYTHRQKEKKK